MDLNLDLIFRIVGVGLIIAFMNIVLKKSEREDFCLYLNIGGAIVILAMLASELANLFETLKTVFGFE
ncbi:MAG: stage III sporulation protein AC [Ruminococcus sp.]|jgi:stage III sporulation protein AC|nr:stage III sporulation protein AC [Ruminococcus sp.]